MRVGPAAAREIGWLLSAAGGLAAMRRAFDATVRAQDERANHGAVLDRWRDMIGDGNRRWLG